MSTLKEVVIGEAGKTLAQMVQKELENASSTPSILSLGSVPEEEKYQEIPPVPDLIKCGHSSIEYGSRCLRCLYKAHRLGLKRPSQGFPQMFNQIDRAQSKFFLGKSLQLISPELPAGMVSKVQEWLNYTIEVDGVNFLLRGPCDVLADLDDGTQMIIDFKTAVPDKHPPSDYSKQLDSYSMALTQAGATVNSWALAYFNPDGYSRLKSEDVRHGLYGGVEIRSQAHDPHNVINALEDIAAVVKADRLPDAAPDCKFCEYTKESLKYGL